MTKHTVDTEKVVDYRGNKGKTETNYGDENETDYRDFEDIDLKITRNDTLLPPPRPFPYLAKNSILEDIANIIKLDMI